MIPTSDVYLLRIIYKTVNKSRIDVLLQLFVFTTTTITTTTTVFCK